MGFNTVGDAGVLALALDAEAANESGLADRVVMPLTPVVVVDFVEAVVDEELFVVVLVLVLADAAFVVVCAKAGATGPSKSAAIAKPATALYTPLACIKKVE